MKSLDDLKALVMRHARGRLTDTGIPRVAIMKGEATTGPLLGLYDPRLCLVLQGAKSVMIGDQLLHYDAGRYFIAAVEVPAVGKVLQASPQHPYLSVSLALDTTLIASLLLDMPPVAEATIGHGFAVSRADEALVDAWLRMIELIDHPAEIPVLAPLLEREILFRLLQGPQGAMLRQIAGADSRLSQIRRALAWIRDHYAEPFRVEDLARMGGMSASVFHRHFKAVTAMTPIQYQKRIRLNEARRRLLATSGDAAGVAFSVGYESASQFSREYARLFGAPPVRDVGRLRATPEPTELA